MGKGERPEHVAPPDVFYNDSEARKYTTNSRMIAIQESLTHRALELLALPTDSGQRLLLDLGCGSGLSGGAITDAGHTWIGCDISPAMLDVALEREVEGDLLLGDLGHGLPLRKGMFDGAISISAVQWLCNADRRTDDPRRRLRRFFETLYASLAAGARAVLQVYPENSSQAEMLVAAAMRAGFSGGLVVDYPHSTRAKKYFLCLMVGGSLVAALPAAKGLHNEDDEDMELDACGDDADEEPEGAHVRVEGRRRPTGRHSTKVNGRSKTKGREWVLRKKSRLRAQGVATVKPDTKYTGRTRRRRL